VKKLRAALLVPALAAPSLASAQVPTVDPSGRQPAAPAPSPQPAAPSPQQPVVITIGPDGQPIAPSSGDAADTSGAGLYHYDDGGQVYDDEPTVVHAGPTPELHVVRRGDTLWDICGYYFNDPWQWPKVWSYNAQITNPHWIYPGDLVRLLPKGMIANVAPLPDDVEGGPDAAGDGQPDNFEPAPARRTDVQLTKMGFVDQQNLDNSITIDGSIDAKELLSTGDGVYLKYPENRPPKVGQRYTIYKTDVPVQHPDSGKKVGSYVRILGELEVSDVKKDRRARAIITAANQEIERGDLVGPLERQFKTVPPVAAKVDAQGTIIAMLTGDQLMGEGAVVFIDLGQKDGLEVGNRMYVVRRGDALEEQMAPSGNVGQDDRRFPARALGQVTLVDVGKSVSVGLVTLSVEELGVGDLVMMRKSE
jgi:hypothetical protein